VHTGFTGAHGGEVSTGLAKLTEEELAVLPAVERKKAEKEARKAERDAAKARTAEQVPPVEPPTPEPPVIEPPTLEPPIQPVVEPTGQEVDTVAKQEYESLQSEYDALKQKHKTLQGKYNGEVPRLQKDLKDLQSKLASRLEALEKGAAQPVAPQPVGPTVPAHLKYLSESEREEAGEGESLLLKQVKGLLDESLGSVKQEIASVRTENEQMKQATEASKQGSRDATIWKAVEKTLPGARSLFDNYLVHEWLESTPDPDSEIGASYFDMANNAFLLGRASEVAATLRAAAEANGLDIDMGEPPPPAQPPVKPARSAGDSVPKSVPGRKMINESELLEYWTVRGKPRGLRHPDGTPWTDTEVLAKEKEYDRAGREGRIIRGK